MEAALSSKGPASAGQIGINGLGGDVAFEVAQHFNVRLGGSYFQTKPSFTSDGAQVATNFRLGYGKASVDWFPFSNGFFISPVMTFGNLLAFRGTVTVPAGANIDLSGKTYLSSATDPLRGAASIDTAKISPGLTIGYGNIVPRSNAHFSFPVEFGFYYVKQPFLRVTFDGSACDPTQPAAIGCKKALSDPVFQSNLANFIARQQQQSQLREVHPHIELRRWIPLLSTHALNAELLQVMVDVFVHTLAPLFGCQLAEEAVRILCALLRAAVAEAVNQPCKTFTLNVQFPVIRNHKVRRGGSVL